MALIMRNLGGHKYGPVGYLVEDLVACPLLSLVACCVARYVVSRVIPQSTLYKVKGVRKPLLAILIYIHTIFLSQSILARQVCAQSLSYSRLVCAPQSCMVFLLFMRSFSIYTCVQSVPIVVSKLEEPDTIIFKQKFLEYFSLDEFSTRFQWIGFVVVVEFRSKEIARLWTRKMQKLLGPMNYQRWINNWEFSRW